MLRFWPFPTVLLGLLLSNVQAAAPSDSLSQRHVNAVVDYLIRPMDTTAQAQRDSRFVGVKMTTCPIQVTGQADPSTVYLYQEQALTENIDSPYRQRFLQITLSADEARVESRTLKPPTPENWTGLCQQAEPKVNAEALGSLVCVVSLRPSTLGYVGTTPDEGCPVNLRGAVRLTNTVVLHQDGMDTWDRGFDAAGIQVWGARLEPYQYR